MTDHLKPYQFKKGEPSPNPTGRPALTGDEKLMRANFKKSFIMLGEKSMDEILEIAKDRKQPAPMILAAKALEWALKKGNPALYREIYDRTIGPVPRQIDANVTADIHSTGLESLDKSHQKQILQNLINRLDSDPEKA